MSVKVVIPNATPGTGEGPHWEEDTQRLVFVDITQHTVHRWDPLTSLREEIKLGDEVGCVVPCKTGGYLVGLGRTISHLDWSSQKVAKLHEIPLHGTNNRFNDGKCDPAGRLWIGSMGAVLSFTPPTFDMEKGELYCLETDGSLHKRMDGLTVSNGLAWTSDHRTMFLIDSVPGQIMAFDYDVNTGDINNKRVVVDYRKYDVTNHPGIPDGMTIDTDNNIWVAHYGSGQVVCFNPQTGTILRKVAIPAKKTTSCCFGGKNLDELYVTCSGDGCTDEERAKCPAIGSVFKVTELGVKGYPANVYNGM